MTHEEYKKWYETQQQYKKDHPDEYPYFCYFQFGFHGMTWITEEELKEFIYFYHLKPDGKGGYFRRGIQPITILPRREVE